MIPEHWGFDLTELQATVLGFGEEYLVLGQIQRVLEQLGPLEATVWRGRQGFAVVFSVAN